jgi:nitroreductase
MQDILSVIQDRQSARGVYDPKRLVARQDLLKILEAARWAPTAHNMQNFEIIVVDDPSVIEAIGNLTYPLSTTFIRENYQQLSFSDEELLQKKVGLPASHFPPALTTLAAARGELPGEQENSFVGTAIKSSPVLLIVLYDPARRAPASEGDFLGIISLGCAMENMWLTASSRGIAFHVVSALSGDRVEKGVKRILDIPAALKIPFACRLGYPVTPPAKSVRVRRDLEDFTSHNRFGNREKM